MGTGRYVVYASLGLGAVVAIRVSYRVWRALSYFEQPYAWINSIIPPSGYDYHKDTADTKEHVQAHHPQLLEFVDQGTLTILKRPQDFDRPLPDELYILGTAHVSRKTAEAVYRTIQEVEPDAVIVELCKSRSFMMYREVPPEMLLLNPSPSPVKQEEQVTAAAKQVTDSQQQNGTKPVQASAALTDSKDAAGDSVTIETPSTSKVAAAADSSKKPTPRMPRLSEELGALMAALRNGVSPLQVLLSWAYKKVECHLDTVVGLEFIRARHAIQDVERKRAAQGNHDAIPLPPPEDSTTTIQPVQQQNQPETDLQGGSSALQALDAAAQQPQESVVQTSHTEQQVTPIANSAVHASHTEQQATPIANGAVQVIHTGQQVTPTVGQQGEVELSDGSKAVQAATAQPVQVYLGDVPIQRTLSRMWGVLRVRQKLRLCWQLIVECLTLQPDDEMLEQLLQQDMLQLMQEELGAEYPEVLGPLLHERNWHLAYTVHQAAEHGMNKVVLIVGRGHVPGVVYCLLHPYRTRLARRASRSSADGEASARASQETAVR